MSGFAMLHYLLLLSETVLANKTDLFTISTNGCTIRRFPVTSDNIQKLIQPPTFTQNCSENIQLVDSNTTHIWIINEAFEKLNIVFAHEFFCCYRNFRSENNLENVVYGDCAEFKSIITVKHEFVRVECYYWDDKVYDDFFVFKNTNRFKPKDERATSYNVLIFGIESVSRLNFHRTMAKTSEFLRQRGSIELLGYNKVGDNSYPNLFPLLMGHTFEFARRTCFDNTSAEHDCQFIWDRFKAAGYYTALGSDSVAGLLGEYEYMLTSIPTHFYLQPVMYEARHLFKNKHYSYHQCLGSKYFYKILLDYIAGLSNTLKSSRLFGMFWEESVSHELLNNPYIMDKDYVELLTKLEKSEYLNETVVIFMSDHGMRWGDFVHTSQGRQEERLPLLRVLFPKSFKQKYKLATKYFFTNRLRLTTPFDVYHTLLDLIDLDKLENKELSKKTSHKSMKQSSLFLPVSKKRTCESVGIMEHWCACYQGRSLGVGNFFRIIAANFLVNHVNNLLKSYPQCQKLTVGRILTVGASVKNGGVLMFTVVMETYPGNAVLDGTVLVNNGSWTVSGTISRLDRYRYNSCIVDGLEKLYCYCK